MAMNKRNFARGSDTVCRHGGTIVPGTPRSGLRANHAMGSTVLFAASGAVMDAIAGTARTCTAGVRAVNAPARCAREKEGEQHVLRLKGGAGGSDVDSDEPQLSVLGGQVLVGGTPLQGVTTRPRERTDGAKAGPSQSVEGRERARERALFGQRSARRAELKSGRGLSDSEDSSDAVLVERARSLDRGRNTRPERRGGASHSDGEEDEEVVVTEVPPRRGPGRPPTTSEYVGLAAAKEKFNLQLEKEVELLHEKRMASLTAGQVLVDGSGKVLAKAEEVG